MSPKFGRRPHPSPPAWAGTFAVLVPIHACGRRSPNLKGEINPFPITSCSHLAYFAVSAPSLKCASTPGSQGGPSSEQEACQDNLLSCPRSGCSCSPKLGIPAMCAAHSQLECRERSTPAAHGFRSKSRATHLLPELAIARRPAK